MSSFDTHYLKPSDIAAHLSVHRSQVYKWIKDGTLPHIRIGKAVRVPAAAYAAFEQERVDAGRAAGMVHDSVEAELESRRQAFEEHVRMDPFDFIDAWKRGDIDDSPENAERAIDALALRAMLQRTGMHAPVGV